MVDVLGRRPLGNRPEVLASSPHVALYGPDTSSVGASIFFVSYSRINDASVSADCQRKRQGGIIDEPGENRVLVALRSWQDCSIGLHKTHLDSDRWAMRVKKGVAQTQHSKELWHTSCGTGHSGKRPGRLAL